MNNADLINNTLKLARQAIEQGDFGLPLSVFGDPGLFELEQRRLFRHTWNFLAHQTEIPQAGDYVLRHIGSDPFLVVRGKDGAVRVLYAVCPHRGMQICRSEMGNTKRFVCPYHGWMFGTDGALVGVPELESAYSSDFSREDSGLAPIPQMAERNGFIFGNLDPHAPSLEDYMGDYAWYFDFWTRKTPKGIEVRGAPQRYVVTANWKLGSENFFGDAYHTPVSHRSVVDTGLLAVGGNVSWRGQGIHYNANAIGGGGLVGLPDEGEVFGYPKDLQEVMRGSLSPSHRQALFDFGMIPASGTFFPNLSFASATVTIDDEGPVRFFTFRQWRPIAPNKMEIISWCATEQEAPEAWKARSERAYIASFGSSGMFEQDDTENWSYVTSAACGTSAESFRLNYRMGLGTDNQPIVASLPDWPGPGEAFPIPYAEHNQRQFWRTWLKYLTEVSQ